MHNTTCIASGRQSNTQCVQCRIKLHTIILPCLGAIGKQYCNNVQPRDSASNSVTSSKKEAVEKGWNRTHSVEVYVKILHAYEH